MARVVVTGLGAVSPLGMTVKETWSNILRGSTGIGFWDGSMVGSIQYDADTHFSKSEQRVLSRYIQFALLSAKEALEDAKWLNLTQSQKDYTVDYFYAGCVYRLGDGELG